ncbi:MAG: hypothetical protein J6S63_01505 [Atopobiaceae bacterium]|nr:hypothetical protein [Atopobiaceae bacterium]
MQQGDQYALPITVELSDGEAITPENCADMRVKMGSLEKSYADGDIVAEYANGRYTGRWLVPLTQAETLAFPTPLVEVQAQVQFTDGSIVGTPVGHMKVDGSILLDEWGNTWAD